MWEKTPNSGGNYFLTQDTYFPNGSVGAISASLSGSSIGIPGLTYAVDGEGRLYSATDATNSLNLVTATAYSSASSPTSITYGNASTGSANDVDSFTYDSNTYRPTNLTYAINRSSSPYSVTTALTWNANWSLQKMVYTDGSPSPLSQTCTYSADDLSRIASTSCGTSTWGQTFSYDPFGNISKTVPSGYGGTAYAAAYSTVTNQVSSGVSPTPTYDANGNQLTSIPATLTWNALNLPISVNSTTATYDALGRMVEKGLSGIYTQFVYRPSGAMLAVFSGSLSKGTIALPGGSTAVYNSSGLNYIRHKDWLGSSRLATLWTTHAVYSKEAYAPFGETYNEAGTADRSFTGQDQNVATGPLGTGAYDFLFRKYDPSAGRWLSPDPGGWNVVDQTDPQSLDRYAYVENQPLTAIDPSGLNGCISTDSQQSFINTGTGNACPAGWIDIGEEVIVMNSCPTCFTQPPPALTDFTDSFDALPDLGPVVHPGVPSTGVIRPWNRIDCAATVADNEYSLAAYTSGTSPDNFIVKAFLGNSVSGVVKLFTSNENPLPNLIAGGWNPGIPRVAAPEIAGVTLDGGLTGVATRLAFGASTDAIGLLKFGYDAATVGYAYVKRCS
jgi:RHS repeat-associated protein